MMNQVVIVGAGPAGATLALLLVRRGVAVKLIEASRNFRRVFRGEGLMPSGVDALAQMGLLPILERIPHRSLSSWEFIIDNRSLFQVAEPIELGGKSPTLVSQPAFLEALIEEASIYPHFEFVHGTVQDLLWSDGRVSGVKLGDDRAYNADLVIGADGRNSIVRQRANLEIEQQSQSFNILWFKMADSPHFQSENVFYSIVNGRHAFVLFQGSEGNLQMGWALHADEPIDWKQIDWSEMFASVSPPWFAAHVKENAATLERPVLLSVVVGCCSRWSVPGLLLLGDAAHPMSPIRAQGINMALRDVIVAVNHLVPLLRAGAEHVDIDTALRQIQAEREPEIKKSQYLQAEEAAQAQLLRKNPMLQWAVSNFAPLIRWRVRSSWIKRQQLLRQGVTQVELSV